MFVQKETLCEKLRSIEREISKAEDELNLALNILGTIEDFRSKEGQNKLFDAWAALRTSQKFLADRAERLKVIRYEVFNGWPQR